MAKEVKKKTKNQVVEIHIYIHQVPSFKLPDIVSSQQQPCPNCGRIGNHVCSTC